MHSWGEIFINLAVKNTNFRLIITNIWYESTIVPNKYNVEPETFGGVPPNVYTHDLKTKRLYVHSKNLQAVTEVCMDPFTDVCHVLQYNMLGGT